MESGSSGARRPESGGIVAAKTLVVNFGGASLSRRESLLRQEVNRRYGDVPLRDGVRKVLLRNQMEGRRLSLFQRLRWARLENTS